MKKKNKTTSMIWEFLKGCRMMFLVSIFSAVIMALADMINPQIIRMAVDNVIGGNPSEFSDIIMSIVNVFGGFTYLKQHIWIMAIAIVIVALVKVVFQYIFRVSNTKASEKFVKNMRDSLFSHIEHLPYSWL